MREAGLEVLVFDMSFVYLPELKKNNPFIFEGYFEVTSLSHFNEIFDRKVKGGFGFIIMPLVFRLLPYYLKIWKSPLKIVVLRLGTLPSSSVIEQKTFAQHCARLFGSLEVLRAFEISFLNRITKRLKIQKEPSLFLCAGERSVPPFVAPDGVLRVGSLDHNIFLEMPPSQEKGKIVFLDEYEPFHPDFDRQNIKKISPQKYFRDLNYFFTFLEKKYGVPVIVAAHPAADLSAYPRYFEGREVIKGKTASLVRDSFGVVAHTSTALQFAFLYKKMFCTFATEEMLFGSRGAIFSSYKKYGFRFFNISAPEDLKMAEFTWDDSLAKNYINDFVISEKASALNTWRAFANYIKSHV